MCDLSNRVPCVGFQYSRFATSKCEGCEQKILSGTLRAKWDNATKYFHFDCFWKYDTTAKCRKDEIMIAVEQLPSEHENAKYLKIFKNGHPYVSLEIFDLNLNGIQPIIWPKDIDRIREHVALAEEGKTLYYVPSIVQTKLTLSSKCCSRRCTKDHTKYYLLYQTRVYHPECLAYSGIVNVDAKDFQDYDTLDDADKKFLDGIFKKTDGVFLLPRIKPYPEYCASKDCINVSQPSKEIRRGIRIGELRVQYKHLTYHPQCLAATGKVNINGKDIPNYDNLFKLHKTVLDKYFIQLKNFNSPIIEKAIKEDYCTAAECSFSRYPSKFPYPYSITKDQIQIRFQGNIYHQKCFEAFGKITVAAIVAKNMPTQEHVEEGENQNVNGVLKSNEKRRIEATDQSKNLIHNDDEPSTKKKKLSENEEIVVPKAEPAEESENNEKENVMNQMVTVKKEVPVKQEIEESYFSSL